MKRKLLGLALAVFMTACSSTTTEKIPDLTKMFPSESEEPHILNKFPAPEWTALRSGVYHDASGKAVFYGLSSVSKDEYSSDRKILSEDRARDELAKVLLHIWSNWWRNFQYHTLIIIYLMQVRAS